MDTLGNMLLTDINCMYKNYYIFHRCIFDKTFLLLRKLPTFPITFFFLLKKKKKTNGGQLKIQLCLNFSVVIRLYLGDLYC